MTLKDEVGARNLKIGSPARETQRLHSVKPEQSEASELDQALRNTVKSIRGQGAKHIAVLSFRALQLYRIGVLQRELLAIQGHTISPSETELQDNGIDRSEDRDGSSERSKENYEGKFIDELLQRYG